MDPLEAISPIDGRYRKYTEPLAAYFSERATMRYRLTVEGEYLIALSEDKAVGLAEFTGEEKQLIRDLYDLSPEDAALIKDIEIKGHGSVPATNHDMKALEYFMKLKLGGTSLRDALEWVHFGLTSEDTSNIAYGLMLSDALTNVMIPAIRNIASHMNERAKAWADIPMLARTHGQPASPTTFGKEFRVFAARLERRLEGLASIKIQAKLNGATGNWNAHVAAYPDVDWMKFSERFVRRFNDKRAMELQPNLMTTQIEWHDTYVAVFDMLRRVNTILVGFDQDIWRYVSDGWLKQKPVAGEVGSSTMPHKINPWFFENSEGNLQTANALFEFFARKLPISRLQRDLSGSTVLRSIGSAFGHSLVGYNYLLRALDRIDVDREAVAAALHAHPEVVTEGIQTILRREGIAMPYEKLKELTRGKTVTMEDIRKFIDGLDVREEVKEELRRITPENYIGLAEKLAEE